MALKPALLLLLWDLTLFVHGVTALCNVSCSTNYKDTLNCSCSDPLPTSPVLVKVICSDEEHEHEHEITGSCEVKPPQSWCVMTPHGLFSAATVGTMCTATASQQDDQILINADESPSWALCDVVKATPPVSVTVTSTDGCYNVSWDHDNKEDILIYRVRVRESKDLSKAPVHFLEVKEKYNLLDCKKLQPYVSYVVDVQAKMSPSNVYLGPWSEWSSTAEWRNGTNEWWWYVTPPVVVLVLLLLGYLQKPWWQKTIRQFIHFPRPNEFFKPLDHSYGGNFKEWVKPLFNEYDYLRINPHTQMLSEKQHDVLQWNNEKQSYGEDEMKQGSHVLHMLQPHSNSLLFFQDGGSSQGTGHSTGHISIHTVTLSGEEEFEEEVVSQSSINTLRSYQDGESFGSFEEDNREHASYDLEEPRRQSGMLPQHDNQIPNELSVVNMNFQPRVHIDEPERVSLDSFVSNEQSEDGYPHVDLDTIDSGFGECGSPGASDSNVAEQRDSDLFQEHKSSNSNYVKQWMICSTTQEDSNNLESKLPETQ